MKAILALTFLSAVTASSATAEVHFETRAFHSKLRMDADRVILVNKGEDTNAAGYDSRQLDTAGLGLSVIAPVHDIVEFGLGLSLARYHPSTRAELNQTALNGFTRINLAQTESGKLYFLAGVSRQQLTEDIEATELVDFKVQYSPIVNGDLGLGGSIKLGPVDLGLEYKYTTTLAPGRATFKNKHATPALEEDMGYFVPSKVKIRDLVLKGQELALTLGMKL